jgi:hypothetical protein
MLVGPFEMEVFKAGKQTDSAGNSREWSETDLDTMVSNYKPETFKAPVVVGHPKDNSPAFGWVESLKRKGKTLVASVKLASNFVETLKEGHYKNRSISLYPDLSLKHIGFLGGMPPAVKGLEDVQFSSDKQAVTFEFTSQDTAWELNSIGNIFSRIRDFFIEKFGLEAADTVLPTWHIDGLKTVKATPEPVGTTQGNFNQGDFDMNELEQAKVKIAELEGKISSFTEEVKTKDVKITSLTTQIEEIQKATRIKEHSNFCDGLISQGKLLPAMRETMIDQLELAHIASSGQFSEGQSPIEKLKKSLEAAPKIVQFGESSGGTQPPAATSAADIAKKAIEYRESESKNGREISFTEAVNHVSRKDK